MNVKPITMDPQLAHEKLQAWLRERHADAREAKEACVKGYEALAAGHELVQLDTAIIGGGFFESGLPKLAIARADRKEVRCTWGPNDTIIRYDARLASQQGRGNPGALMKRVDVRRMHGKRYGGPRGDQYSSWLEGYAQVPMVPADVRPSRGQLSEFFILWEVERWFSSRRFVEPDRDPMLLQHIAGQLYSVRAQWDLTELERAVMAGAFRPEPQE